MGWAFRVVPADMEEDMEQTTSRPTSTASDSGFGVFERTHLLERLSLLYIDPASMRRLASAERPDGSSAAYRMALTADERLAAYGYRLDEQSLTALAQHYAAGDFLDPVLVVGELLPTPDATPMYPDFPTQVMSMDEATYRLHQAVHYLSTYGIESIAAQLGTPVEVVKGWLPDVEQTEKTEVGDALLETRALSLAFTLDEVAQNAWQHLVYRNERMTDSDVRLVSSLPVPADADGGKIVFHENALMLLKQALMSSKGSPVEEFVQRARHFAAHPGDVVKFVVFLRESMQKNEHLPTSWRRRLVALLESYATSSLEENLTLDRERSLRVLELVSYNRFSRSVGHRAVVDALRDGTLRSWASRKEDAYRSGDADQVVRVLCERPGVMLREVVRMMRVGVSPETIEASLHGAKLSLATLLNATAKLSAPYDATRRMRNGMVPPYLRRPDGTTANSFVVDPQLIEQEHARRKRAAHIMHELLVERLRQLDTPLRGRKMLLDSQGYDLAHSYVMTNVARGTSSYFAPGMAATVPEEAERVRFFAFWDDRSKRVDLDLHAVTDTGEHVGWDGAFNQSGLTMSGDVTHSKDAVEYLDVDFEKAAKAGVSYVKLTLHYYNGGTFDDIAKAFTGLLVVGRGKPNRRLYQSDNVLMRNDLSETHQRRMAICLIDVRNRCVVPFMGGEVPYGSPFTAQRFLDDLLEAQGATLVAQADDLDEAGVRVTVGKPAQGEVSLMDQGWFVLE